MTLSELDVYYNTVDVIEEAVYDDTKFPVVKDKKTKNCCMMALELTKVFINYIKHSNKKNATKKED